MKKFSKNSINPNNLYEILLDSCIQIQNDEIKSTSAKAAYTNPIVLDNSTNPFEQRVKIENDIQKYFNEKYFKINSKIKEVILSLNTKNGSTTSFIKDTVIDSETIVAKYFYDKNLKLHDNDRNDYSVSKEKNIYNIEVNNDSYYLNITFTPSSLLKIIKKTDNETKVLTFKKRNLLERIFVPYVNLLSNYEKRNKYGDLIEAISFLKTGKPEKYTKYRLNKKEFEIIFDSSDWQKFTSNKDENQIIPLEYYEYDFNQTVLTKLDFQYSKPHKYTEFNSNTGKMTKTFDIQGLYSVVFKYSFYNSITGQILAFGKL